MRDEYVNAKISTIDLHFGEFEKSLFTEGVGGGIATDWIKLALGGAGAVIASASQALSAAAAGVEGAKASFDKQAFFANTMTRPRSTNKHFSQTHSLRLWTRIERQFK